MPRSIPRAILLFFLFSLPAAAQSVLNIPVQQCAWHAGDDTRWAAQQLDENGWQPYSSWKSSATEPHLWVRCRVDLSALRSEAHPAIQVSLYSAYQVYLDGTLIGAEGNLGNGKSSLDSIRSYPIPVQLLSPDSTSGSSTLTLRITDRKANMNGGPYGAIINSPLQLRAGDVPLLDALRARTALTSAVQYAPTAISFGIIGVLAVVLLGMFLYDRSRTELLLLSLGCLSLAALRINEFTSASLFNYSISAGIVIVGLGNIGMTLTQAPFYYALARRRMPRPLIALLVLLSMDSFPAWISAFWAGNQPALMGPLIIYFVRPSSLFAHTSLSLIPFFVFWPYAAIPRRMRPLAALCMLWSAADFVWFVTEMTAWNIPGIPDLFARWGLTLLAARAVTTACVLTALLALLFRDQRQATAERALFAGEVHAARDVQQYLIPAQLPATPGLSISSEYRPSREVGGDFFQVLPDTTDGSVLIVVGDVAGKGIEAGMLATLIVGSIRTAASFTSDPARILALLNERLRGRGLVTCLALRIEQDGDATLINAGHLPPYLNGKELAVEGALPLGAISGLHLPALHFTLAAGDSLMLMTDGVAEAQNARGQLFGFERIAQLLREGSDGAALATAAQDFGQHDDITVLTLTMVPVGAVHA